MEIASRSHCVGFTFELPGAIGGTKIAPLLTAKVVRSSLLCPSMVDLIGPHVLLEVLGRIQHGARFHQGHLDPHLGEGMDDRSAAGTGADHDDVIDL